MRTIALVWAAFIALMLWGAVLVTQGRIGAGLAAIGLPIVVTTALTLLYYSRERSEG